eukprot:907384-Rhodomonas_salina.1
MDVMNQFKASFLTAFEGTDDGEVSEYLGCEVQRDWKTRELKLSQLGYTACILKIYGMEDSTSVRTPLSPG